MESPQRPGRRKQRHWPEQKVHDFLGAVELSGGLGVILCVFAQIAAAGLMLVMLGAIQKKIFVWHTGFWGKSGTNGRSYDTMLLVMNLVIVTTGGGKLSLEKCLE